MNGWSGRWRRLAASFLQHAALVLPGEHSPWLEAMRRELDYIETGSGALSWALGCVLTSYKARLTHWSRFSVRTAWRWVGTAGALIVLIIASLQGPASGQTEPIRPAFHETTCDDLPNVSPEVRPRLRCGTVSVPRDYA